MDNAVAADKYSEDWREATIIFNYCTLDTVQQQLKFVFCPQDTLYLKGQCNDLSNIQS